MKKYIFFVALVSLIFFALPLYSEENEDSYHPEIERIEADTPPVVIKEARPTYPIEAQYNDIEGTVTVKCVVTKEGDIVEPEIIEANPPGYFEEAAIETIKQYEFMPARRNGEPVDATVNLQIDFSLKNQGAEYDANLGSPALLIETSIIPLPDELMRKYGKVVVKYIVTKEGNIKNPMVIESNPPGVFDDYALETVNQYKYQPATRNGVPVDSIVKSPVEFNATEIFSEKRTVSGYDVYKIADEGEKYLNKGEYDKAIASFTKAIKINDKYSVAYSCRGIAYMGKGDYTKAMADFDKAIKMDPDVAIFYQSRGNLYAVQENYQKAIKDYSKAINLDKDMVDAYFKRGEAFRKSGKYEDAIKDYSKVIVLDAGNVQAYNNRGYSYNKLNDMENTCVDLKKACELGDCRGMEILKKAGKCSDMAADLSDSSGLEDSFGNKTDY